MNQSESIAALSAALAKAQGVMEGATKDSSNPFFKSKYADLSSVWDACRKPLSDNGLSVVQTSEFIPEHPDMVCIETLLCHSSGEWIKGRLAVKPVKADPQSVGSCITYLRRYSLQSIVGIAPEDDDGNAASGKHDDKAKPIAQSKKVEPTPTSKEKDDVPIDVGESNFIDESQKLTLEALIVQKDVDLKKFLDFMGVDSLEHINADEYEKAHKSLKMAKGRKAA
jgi:hypothetical protein